MSLKARILIFCTFFGNCLVIGLIIAAFTTDNFVVAIAKKIKTEKGEGKINFGIFNGYKSLNYGYGLRKSEINVIELLKAEPDIMSYWYWFFSALALGFALFSSAVSSVASIVGSVKKDRIMFLLVISHIASLLGEVVGIGCWILQYLQYLRYNVLSYEDQKSWSTADNASLGYSFYFVVISFFIIIVNFVLLYLADKTEKREISVFEQPPDEKTEGAIMLY